jgi:hypothetical protein
MAQPVPTLNYGALKVSLPANLPRNEKDLICMILAGRLKDIWNGKLLCAELAIKDLLKQAFAKELTGLAKSLLGINSAISQFKQLSGYNAILGAVNGVLSKLEAVFSLGGMCPSTVKAPRIPDVIGELNANLFGQASGILNSLINIPNAKACISGGPKGLSLDWNGDQISGHLVNIKKLIDNDVTGTTLDNFVKNLDLQTRRLNAEIARLSSNISDPLGINDRKDTASSIQYTKSISDGITVKDRNGVEYTNPTNTLVTGEIDTVINREGSQFEDPIRYEVVEVLDYCGKVVGYEKKIVSGDAGYMGWDMVNTDLYDDETYNSRSGTALPSADFAQYSYTFVEENNTVNVYDSSGKLASEISIQRGKHYRIGFQLTTKSLQFFNGSTVWYHGIRLANSPEHGRDLEMIDARSETVFNSQTVEIDWAVAIEIASYTSPFTRTTTPNSLTWRTLDNIIGNITVSGPTAIPEADKAHDISMVANKAWLFRQKNTVSQVVAGETLKADYEDTVKTRQYTVETTIKNLSSTNYQKTSTIAYSESTSTANTYTVIDDYTGYVDSDGNIIKDPQTNLPINLPETAVIDEEGNVQAVPTMKIVKIIQTLSSGKYLVIKKYINDYNGIDLHQLACYITQDLINEETGFEPVISLTFDQSVTLLNDIKLPFTGYYDYKLIVPGGKILNTEEFVIEKTQGKITVNLSRKRKIPNQTIGINEFIYTSEISVNDLDPDRSYIHTDPTENQTYLYFKGANGFEFETKITLVN